MKYKGSYKYCQHNNYTVVFPNNIINSDIKDEIEFNVRKATSDQSISPSFDKESVTLYTDDTIIIIFNRPSNEITLQVSITSTMKNEDKKFVLAQSTP